MEKSILIANKSASLLAIIILDPVTQEKNLRGMGKINIEHWWLRVVLSLLTAKWNKIVCVVNCQPINWILGWERKNRSLNLSPSLSAFLSYCIVAAASSGLILFILFGIYLFNSTKNFRFTWVYRREELIWNHMSKYQLFLLNCTNTSFLISWNNFSCFWTAQVQL